MRNRSFVIDYPRLRSLAGLSNPHLQTVASILMKYQNSTRLPTRRLVSLSDGDRVIIHDDKAKSWITGDRIAILFHGLCGCHNSPYMRRIAIKLRRRGVRTVRVDMRGFGDSSLISTGHLHAGRSADIRDIVDFVIRLSPLSKISLIGFSLGANILLKYLIESGDRDPDLDSQQQHVDSAIAVSPPADLIRCSSNLRTFGNRLYDYYFVRRLKRSLIYRRRHVAGLLDNHVNPLPNRLLGLDDQFTAPVSGFSGARDYYEKCSTAHLLDRITTPTILVAAEDDPIIPCDIFQPQYFSSSINFVKTKTGGHLGFLGAHAKDPDKHWLDWRICQWVDSLDD